MFLLNVKVWSEMEQTVHTGLPTPGSDREKMFQDCTQKFRDIIHEVVQKKRSGEEQKSIPFLDSLLQSGAPDEQVRNYICAETEMHMHMCMHIIIAHLHVRVALPTNKFYMYFV